MRRMSVLFVVVLRDDRHGHIELNDIHRGDTVTPRGRWDHGTFYAWRIENLSTR